MNRNSLFDRLLPTLPEGKIIGVHIGLYWTAVLAEVGDEIRCGLAATVGDDSHHYTTEPSLSRAGHLTEFSSRKLAEFVHSPILPEVSVGLATVNALLPRLPNLWVDLHSKEVLARLGAGKNVVMVGRRRLGCGGLAFPRHLRERSQNRHPCQKSPHKRIPSSRQTFNAKRSTFNIQTSTWKLAL